MSRDCQYNPNIPRRVSLWPLLLPALLLSLVISSPAFAKGGDPVWLNPVVDATAGEQYAKAMAVDLDGNIIVVGSTNAGNNDYQMVKFKADGSGTAWPPISSGGSGNDEATAVAVDSARNIIVTGSVRNTTTLNYDIRTIKYDKDGVKLWEHDYDAAGGDDKATAVAVDEAGNIYVAGYAVNGTRNEDFLVIKYLPGGPVGNLPAWEELSDDTAYPNNKNQLTAIVAGVDGIAVTGYSSKGGADFDIITRKYGFDKSLVRAWRKASPGNLDDHGVAVKMDSLGNVIMTGYVTNGANNKDIHIAKYDPASDTPVWEKSYDGNGEDEPKGLWVDNDTGDVYVTGATATLAGNTDFYTVHYSSAGNREWESIYDTGNGAADIPVALVVDKAVDGGVFVTGYTTASSNEDYLTLKYRKDNGYLLWQTNLNGSGSKDDRPVGIALIPDSGLTPRNVVVAGWSYSNSTLNDFTAIKYDFGALNAPTKLTATVASNSSITLTWSDNSINEEKFVIQRKLGGTDTWVDLPDVTSPAPPNSANTVTHPDSGLDSNKYYYYRVRANNTTNGDSYYSNEAHALTKVVSYDPPAWSYRYDGTRGDYATAILTDSVDKNPVVSGYSALLGEGATEATDDYMTIKLDRTDNSVKWKARYDSDDTDQAAGLALDNNGDLLVTGTAYLTRNGDSSDDIYTVKFRTSTVTDPATPPGFVWGFPYGEVASTDFATAIGMIRDSSNNSVVIGYGQNPLSTLNDDVFIIKLNNIDGSRPWEPVVYDSGRNDQPSAVATDAAGNIFVTGYSFDFDDTILNPTGSYDWFTRKYDGATGALIWTETFDGGHGDDQALSLDVDAAGNAYVSGYTMQADGKTAFHTVKYRSAAKLAGEEQWIWGKSFNYPGFDAEAMAVKVDPIDNAVVVAGNAYVSATDSDFHLIRYNSADGSLTEGGGKPFWEINFDRPETYDYVTAMTLDPSGYIYLAGNTRSGPESDQAFNATSNITALIYDFEGTFLGATNYDGAGREDDATAIAANYVGEAFIAGSSVNAANNADYLVLKQANSGLLVPAPFTVVAQTDYSKVDIGWQHNNASATFSIERTPGPVSPFSEWTEIDTPGAGSILFTDTSLTAETSYCYRISANYNSFPSRKTAHKCVTTRVPPPVLDPLIVDPDPLNPKITLNWNQVTNNAGYKIERKIGAGAWGDLITKATNQNFHADTGLSTGTTYSYRVTTINAGGNSMPSNEQSAITRPAAPTLAAPTNITNCQMALSWSPGVTGASSYTLEYKPSGGSYAPVTGCNPAATSCTATQLANNTTYYFRVKASNVSGDSAWSSPDKSGATSFTPPTLNNPYNATNNSIELSWNIITIATKYTLYGKDGIGGTYAPVTGCQDIAGTSCVATGLLPTHTYYFRVTAGNSCGSSDYSNEKYAPAILTAPTLPAPTGITDTQLTLTWAGIYGANKYYAESKPSGGSYTPVTGCNPATQATCTPTGLTPNVTYTFRVKAGNDTAGGDSAWSNELPGRTLLPKPSLTAVTGTMTTNINIGWNDVAGENNYVIERNPCSDSNNNSAACAAGSNYSGAWSVITNGTRPADSIFWADNSAVAGTQYMYRIKATTSAGNYSAYSTENLYSSTLLAQPAMTSIVPFNSTTFDVNWSDITGETSYTLERKTGVAGTYAPVPGATDLAKNTVTFRDAGLSLSTEYCYRVQAKTSFGVASVYSSNELCKTTPLPEPTLQTPTVQSGTQIRLDWNQVDSNTGYEVERCLTTDNNQPITHPLGTCTNLTPKLGTDINYFTNTVTAGNTYRYRVRAWYNSSTEYTGWSAEQWATAKPPTPVLTTPGAANSTQLNLSWGNVAGDNGYALYWKERSGASCTDDNWSGPIAQALNAISYPHSGLSSGTYYCYKIKATAPPGSIDSDFSGIVSQMTFPATPAQPSLSNISASSITVGWTNVTGNNGYKIYRSPSSNWNIGSVGKDETMYIDNSLDSGTTYTYYVSATSPVGETSYSPSQTATTTPAIPTLTGTVISDDAIDICWPLVFGATSYKVDKTGIPPIPDQIVTYATSYCGGPYPTVACPSLTPNVYCFHDTGLTENTTYSYRVHSANGTDSPASNEVIKTTLDVAAQNLTAIPLDGGFTIQLNWTPVACSPTPCDNPDSFEIQRQLREGVWGSLATVSGATLTYTDNKAIDPNKDYRYRVRSIKGANISPFSAEAAVFAKQYTTGANVCR